MSDNSISEIDCNDLLNQIGLGADENKDENNKKETKKRRKVRTNINKNSFQKTQNNDTQTNKNKNKAPLINLDAYINPKKSDFEIDDDDFSLPSENNLSNQTKNVANTLDTSNTNNNMELNLSQISQPKISTDYEDIHSYSSLSDNNNIKSDNKPQTDSNEKQNNFEITNERVNEDQKSNTDIFNIDSISDTNKKKSSDSQKEMHSAKENKIEDQPKKVIENSNTTNDQKPQVKRSLNKPKKKITRIDLSKCFDLQMQNNNNTISDDNKINSKNNDSFANINNIISNAINEDENANETHDIYKEKRLDFSKDNKINRSALPIEQRISDYLNLSIKKVITDFTTELSSLLSESDLFDSIIKRFMIDIRKEILDNIDFSNNDQSNLSFSYSQPSSFIPDYYSSSISELNTSTEGFKDIFIELNGYSPLNSEKSLLRLTECQSQIQASKNFLADKISPLILDIHNEVQKSAKKVKLKVKKFKLLRKKSIIYDKLFDLEKREYEHQIESRISEINRIGLRSPKSLSPISASTSFYEEDSITERIREFSMIPTIDDISKELTPIIKYLKKKAKPKTRSNVSFSTDAESLSLSNLSTSFFPISPISSSNAETPLQYYSSRGKEIKKDKEESRTLRQAYQQKLQEFCSNSSLLTMEQQSQLSRQTAATAASISLLQTNPTNFYDNNVTKLNRHSNSNTKILNEDDIENDELLNSLRLQVDEMNRKMEEDVNSTTQFIKKVSRRNRRHSVNSSHHNHRHHHRHSSIAPVPSIQRGKLELSSEISLSNVSDNESMKFDIKKNERRKASVDSRIIRSSLDGSKNQIKKKDKNIQTDTFIKKQDNVRRKSHSKH